MRTNRGLLGCATGIASLITILAALAFIVTGLNLLASRVDPLDRQVRSEQAWRQSTIDDRLEWVDTAAAAVWRVAPAIGVTVVSIGLPVVALLALYRRWCDVRLLEARQVVDLQRASRQFPDGLQTLSFHDSSKRPDPAALLPGDTVQALAPVPSMAQLLASGQVAATDRDAPLLLGFDDQAHPVAGSWLSLYSTAIGGVSGSGKSSTLSFLAAQAVCRGAKLILLDPHAAAQESTAQRLAPLADLMLVQPAESPREIKQTLDLVQTELDQRRSTGVVGQPWVIIADEFSALQRGDLALPVSKVFEGLGQEGRKLALYGLASGQVWTASRSGGSELRDSLASAFIHRMRAAQVRYMTGLLAEHVPPDVYSLPPGTCYLLDTTGHTNRLRIPLVTDADMVNVAREAKRSIGFHTSHREATGKPDGSHREANAPVTSTASQSAETAQVLVLFRQGLDIAEIVKKLYPEATAGRRYQEKSAQVQALLRQGLGNVNASDV